MEITTDKNLIFEPYIPKKEKKEFVFRGSLEEWKKFYELNKDKLLKNVLWDAKSQENR